MANIEYLSLEDQQQLNKTQTIRNNLIDNIIKEGIPDDKNIQNLLVNLLNGSDNAVFNKAKLKAKSDENQDNKNVVNMMTQILLRTNKLNKEERETVPELDDSYEVDDLVPGEDAEVDDEMDYDKFIEEYDEEKPDK